MYKRQDLSYGHVGVDVEDAIRLNASCIVVQTFVGSKNEVGSFKNLSDMINAGNRYGIPVMGVTAVGKEMERTKRYFQLATRILEMCIRDSPSLISGVSVIYGAMRSLASFIWLTVNCIWSPPL